MYPDFRYLLGAIGIENAPEWLGLFKTFGLLVALSFMAAAWTLSLELKRKEKEGYFLPDFTEETVGKPASANELLWSAFIGFLVGYKVGGFFGHVGEISPNPLGYLFSIQGNPIGGLIGAALFGYMKWSEKRKQQLPEPAVRKIDLHPHQRIMELVMLAAIGGFAGAKIFNAFENWDDFLANPASLLASAGFTFYGGLIVAAIAIYFFARKRGWDFRRLCDATAPGLILAYGIGRLGCQMAGDGDWGIANSAYITDISGELQRATDTAQFRNIALSNPEFLYREYGSPTVVKHAYAPAPSWLPRGLFAMNYPHNVNNIGSQLPDCNGEYCSVLPFGVFPTPIYEAIACIGLFFFLWGIRKKLKTPLHLFGVYLIVNGLERFLVEKIRVNTKYDWGFLHPTQAEIISTCLMLAGLCIVLFYRPKPKDVAAV